MLIEMNDGEKNSSVEIARQQSINNNNSFSRLQEYLMRSEILLIKYKYLKKFVYLNQVCFRNTFGNILLFLIWMK